MEGVLVVSVVGVSKVAAAVAVEVISTVAVAEVSVPAVFVPSVATGELVRSPGTLVSTAVGVPSSEPQADVTNTKASAPNKSMREILFIFLLLLLVIVQAVTSFATFVFSFDKSRILRTTKYHCEASSLLRKI